MELNQVYLGPRSSPQPLPHHHRYPGSGVDRVDRV
jgi:hypothetical protein